MAQGKEESCPLGIYPHSSIAAVVTSTTKATPATLKSMGSPTWRRRDCFPPRLTSSEQNLEQSQCFHGRRACTVAARAGASPHIGLQSRSWNWTCSSRNDIRSTYTGHRYTWLVGGLFYKVITNEKSKMLKVSTTWSPSRKQLLWIFFMCVYMYIYVNICLYKHREKLTWRRG